MRKWICGILHEGSIRLVFRCSHCRVTQGGPRGFLKDGPLQSSYLCGNCYVATISIAEVSAFCASIRSRSRSGGA